MDVGKRAGVSIRMEPRDGATLVSGATIPVSISVHNKAASTCQDLEVRITMVGESAHLQLQRRLLLVPPHQNSGIVDAVVPVTTGIWTLSAVLYCSFARVDSAGIISELKQNVERHPYSTSSEGIVARAHHTTLMLAMSQIELGHVEEARQTLDVAREEYLSSDSIAWKGIFVPWIQELIQMVDHDLAQIDVSTVASHSVVVLVVSQESKNHFTMEQGCPALLSFTPQEKRAGFAEFTWTRTLECLSAFLEKFPTNSEAKLWHSRIDQHCGERVQLVYNWKEEGIIVAVTVERMVIQGGGIKNKYCCCSKSRRG